MARRDEDSAVADGFEAQGECRGDGTSGLGFFNVLGCAGWRASIFAFSVAVGVRASIGARIGKS